MSGSYHFRNMKTKHENYIAWQFLECKKLHALAYFTLLDLYENEKKKNVAFYLQQHINRTVWHDLPELSIYEVCT